jgi:N-acetyl-anhydromuramyl-L-alanine amidase AmpD
MAPRYPGNSTFLEAAQYTRAPGSNGTVVRIVIHDMEIPERPDTAEACARMFHTTTAQKSAHFCVDNNSCVQCVDVDRRAWHAPPNRGSVGIEHAGFAGQNLTSWLDAYGRAMLDVSARLVAWLCGTLEIPARWMTVAQVRAGERGICTHADVSAAFRQTDHTDPGGAFPKDYYLGLVKAYLSGGDVSAVQPTLQEIQKGILYYDMGRDMVNPITVLSRLYEMVSDQAGILKTIQDAGRADAVDVPALAKALAALLPTTLNVDARTLAVAVSDEIHLRMAS